VAVILPRRNQSGVKLAVGAEDKNAVNAVGNEVIEKPLFQTRQVEISLSCMGVATGGMMP